jgi:protoporphyrinogen oxidase
MMWEKCAELITAKGGQVHLKTKVVGIRIEDGKSTGVDIVDRDGSITFQPASHVISTMPMAQLVDAFKPVLPDSILTAGHGLHYRDFLTVALVIPEELAFPDNWIYIHAQEVKVGRIQNFGSWSPYLVKEGRTCLGLEYFVFEGDELWSARDEDLIEQGKRELEYLGLAKAADVEMGYVFRMPKAYPYYDSNYQSNVKTISSYLETHASNVHLIGRNGMHKYNNQDHSMFTAILTVDNIYGGNHDVWNVNVEEEYHETGKGGTGRDAPILPARTPQA